MKRLVAASTLCVAFCFAASSTPAAIKAVMTAHMPTALASGTVSRVGVYPPEQHMNIAISLPLRDEAAARALIEQIYDPGSSNYHRYLSVEDFVGRFGPTQSDYDAVVDFAKANGLTVVETSQNRLVVDVEGPASAIQTAFHVTLGLYQHPTENRIFFAPDREPTVDLAVPLLHIAGLDNFTLPHPKNVKGGGPVSKGLTGSGPGGQFIGSDLRSAYYGSGSLKGEGQTLGLFEFNGYNVSDVKAYFAAVGQTLSVPIKGVSLNKVSVNCSPPSCTDDSEQVLDIETAISMAPSLDQVVVYVGSSDVSIINRMASDNTAKQLSISWGWSDDQSSLDPIFEEMVLQGQTVFVATGDSGSATTASTVWPSDDAFVTAVGGTNLTTKSAGGSWKSESGWSGSAGGKSKNGIDIPSYQSGIANASNDASKTLRNYPDVAATASGLYSCYDGGCSGYNGGTSYAAPQWAGLMALANEDAEKKSRSPFGFLNPALYKIGKSKSDYADDFHDIKSGSNGAYSAVKGYDLVTGWGSPQSELVGALAGEAPKPTVTISYHQVGACNGYPTKYGETSAGAKQAFVVYDIEKIVNNTDGKFAFDPKRLFVHQAIDNSLDPAQLGTIPASKELASTSIAAGKDLKIGKFGSVIVQTSVNDGASEADKKAFPLKYKARASDPDIKMDNTDSDRTSWPSTPDCTSIALK